MIVTQQQNMEELKKTKIIAVDTSIGTNLLLSACEDATISELRGLIQKEHISCFPEHKSINIGALMVEYSQKQYHVTDALLIGQVFRKRWNKIHAEVSLGSLRSKDSEHESFADGKMGELGAALDDDRPMAMHPVALLNAMDVDKEPSSDEAPACGSSARAKVLNNCIGTAPARIADQGLIDREQFRCPLLSIESPYTQPCSELNAVTRAVFGRRKKGTFNRWYVGEDGIGAKKQKRLEEDCQISCKSDRDMDLSPNNINASRTEEELKADKHKDALESFQQNKQDTDCRDGFNEKAALTNCNEHFANAYDVPGNYNRHLDTGSLDDSFGLDNCMANGGTMEKKNEDSLPTNTEVFLSSPEKMKLPSGVFKLHQGSLERGTEEIRSCRAQTRISESVLNKECANLERKTEEPGSQTSAKTGTKECPEMSTTNQEEEPSLNDRACICHMDLSRGYPIQLNDHSILLVASMSADVVLETQESQMQFQDGIKSGVEEEVLQTKGGLEALETGAVEPHYRCVRHEHYSEPVDPVEPQEMKAQDARNMNTKKVNNQVKDLVMLVDKEENSKLKPPEGADQPSRSHSPQENAVITEARQLCAGHFDCEKQLLDASFSGGNRSIYPHEKHGKKKKRRRRKVSEIQKVITQEDSTFVSLDNEQHDVQGGVDPEKTMDEDAQFKDGIEAMNKRTCNQESLIEAMNGRTCNHDKADESSHDQGIQAQNDMRSSGNVNGGPVDLGSSRNKMKKRKVSRKANASGCNKRQKNSSLGVAIRSPKRGECNESASIAGKSSEKNSIESCFKPEIGEECMEDCSIGAHKTVQQENLSGKQEAGKDYDTTCWKELKLRKEPSMPVPDDDDDDDAEFDNRTSNCEKDPDVNNYKENEFRPSIKEDKEMLDAQELLHSNNLNANVDGEQAMKKKSRRKKKVNTDTHVHHCVPHEQDHNMTTMLHDVDVLHADVDDTESLLKDGLVTLSSTVSSLKEGLVTTKQDFDVFEFEGSETLNRQKENLSNVEATSNTEADNLDKLCSVAVKFVEDDMLNPSMTTTRKTGRKSVHPKRWITVLSERLTWNQASKSSSKKKRASKRSRLSTKGSSPGEMPSDDDFDVGASHMEASAKDGNSQGSADDGRISCPEGCGRRYSKKTSAYYRHRRRCSG